MIYTRILTFLVLSILVIELNGQVKDYVSFDQNTNQVYLQIINLDYVLAKRTLASQVIPSRNKVKILLENYNDFFRLFIHENKVFYSKTKHLKAERIAKIQSSSLEDEWKNFLQAEIHLQWALVHLKMEDNFAAFQSTRQALELLESNKVNYPNFKYTYKSLGILHAILSTIPESFTWATKLMGLSGTIKEAKLELDVFLQFAESEDHMMLDEAIAAKAFMLAYLENKSVEAYQYLSKRMVEVDPNPLMTFIHARIAMRAGYNDATINVIQSLPIDSRKKLPFLEYLLGIAKLQKLDDGADSYFLNYVSTFHGSSYIKEAYQKLAWNALIKGNVIKFEKYRTLCITKGSAVTDEDKQAQAEANRGVAMHPALIQARLLSDGNYAILAEKKLIAQESSILSDPKFRLEYFYRLARIYQLQKNKKKALENFERSIREDPTMKSFMSCNALLQMGIMFEEVQDIAQARKFYKLVLDRSPDQYARSLHQKAKAGLLRLK
ncbi:MAG: tetratricopeptide repeat protein [Saprospiraceae bacterium]|nr:tetratricopeptide repeat protein [Saprospiraceae bacterium]